LMVASHEITNKYFKRWSKIHAWTHDRINWAIPLQLGIIVQIIIIYLILRK